jgi:nitrogen fixation/metabolism regulation signal transduction histidine kinase
MMLAGAALVLFAALMGRFLAGRFVRPVRVLISGAGEMSRGNLRYRIPQQYRDEFQHLVAAFNAMANSLDEQQQALDRRRQYIENILNHITTAVISIDNTMHIATVNPAAAEMLGVDPASRGLLEEVVSLPGTWPELANAVRLFLASPRELRVREVAEYRSNRELYFRLVYVPLFQQEEWGGAVLLVEDISDVVQSNRLAAFAEMARRVAHEVKNPLTPIQLAVEHLVRVYEDRSGDFEGVLKNCSQAVLKQVKALRKLVSEFSQYGRPSVLNRVETDLSAFLEDIVKSYETHLPPGVRMETQFGADLPRVRIDVEKVRGAIMNIVENGLQAVNGSGIIRLRASSEDHAVQIAVQDSGTGVPAEILPRLFEPYFSTKTGGTGLGLAIARKNLEDHGGAIAVESSPGKGTTVTITLPAAS